MYPFIPRYNPPKLLRTEDTRRERVGKITVEGIGSLTVEPDIAKITTGVLTVGEDAKKAQFENKEIMNKVINSIKANGVADEDIKTITYSVRPDYDYSKGGQLFKGFQVRQMIQITIRDVEKIDKIVDDTIENGANLQNGINFAVSDFQQYYIKALDLAVSNSIDKAMNIARSHGMMINEEPIRLKEMSSVLQQGRYRGGFLVLAESETIETGTLEVMARVEAEFQII